METAYLDVDKRWGIVVCYDYDVRDYADLRAVMRSFGMSRLDANRALDILSSYNTGMAVSNEDLRMSAIFISKATSSSEFWSTAIHELKHSADAIISYYGVTGTVRMPHILLAISQRKWWKK
jgi:hypothetical protein